MITALARCWKSDSREVEAHHHERPGGRAVSFSASSRRSTHSLRDAEPNSLEPTPHSAGEERCIVPAPTHRHRDASGNTRPSRHSAGPGRLLLPLAGPAADPLELRSVQPLPADQAAGQTHLPVIASSPRSPPKTSGCINADCVQRLRKSRAEHDVFVTGFRMYYC